MSISILRSAFIRISPRVWSSSGVLRWKSSLAEDAKTKVKVDDDMPHETMSNPFVKQKKQCILCRYNVQVDYKNVRLLSQFVSPFTGKLYDKHITGLCETQHRAVKREMIRAREFGLMSPYYRHLQFKEDPKLFDPTRPTRPNPY